MRGQSLVFVSLALAVGCKSFEKVDANPNGTGGTGGAVNCNHQVTFKDDFERGPGQGPIGSSQVPGTAWTEDAGGWVINAGDLVLTGNLESRASSPHNTTGYRARLRFKATLSSELGDEAGAGFLVDSTVAGSGVAARISRAVGRTGIYEGGVRVEDGPELPAGEYYVELEVSGASAVMKITQSNYASLGGFDYAELDTDGLIESEKQSRFVVLLNQTSVILHEVSLEAAEACP